MPIARLAHAFDLPSLLALFAASEVSLAAEPFERAECVWRETLAQPGVHVFVSDERDRIAATCMLITAPNLLRSGRRHGSGSDFSRDDGNIKTCWENRRRSECCRSSLRSMLSDS